jgi:hypothetical protein
VVSGESCTWTVYECRPGQSERVAGTVTAVTWEQAWDLAIATFGSHVNHVQAREDLSRGSEVR